MLSPAVLAVSRSSFECWVLPPNLFLASALAIQARSSSVKPSEPTAELPALPLEDELLDAGWDAGVVTLLLLDLPALGLLVLKYLLDINATVPSDSSTSLQLSASLSAIPTPVLLTF